MGDIPQSVLEQIKGLSARGCRSRNNELPRGNRALVEQRKSYNQTVAVSFMTVAELYYGVNRSSTVNRNTAADAALVIAATSTPISPTVCAVRHVGLSQWRTGHHHIVKPRLSGAGGGICCKADL
jgi:predicted nucleic acid-binding protein